MKFLVIGLGEFGSHVANALSRLEHEVCVIDGKEDKINRVRDLFDSAHIADCTKIDFKTSEINVKEYDACIVTVGDNFEASLVVIDKLKQAGAKRIVAKAYSEVQCKFLKMAGADEIYFPEKESADRIARTITNSKLIDFNKISDELGIFQIVVPSNWIGKRITELKVRREDSINILAVKSGRDAVPVFLNINYAFSEGDMIYVFTSEKSIKKYLK